MVMYYLGTVTDWRTAAAICLAAPVASMTLVLLVSTYQISFKIVVFASIEAIAMGLKDGTCHITYALPKWETVCSNDIITGN